MLKMERKRFAVKIVGVWIFQVSLSVLIFREAYETDTLSFNKIPSIDIGFTRFIAGMVMHVIVSESIQNGLKKMKYAANHWWKFSNPRLAWLAGFLQVTSTVVIGIINYCVICISDNVLDLAKDFVALIVINEFDDFIARAAEVYAKFPELSVDCCTEK